MSHGDRNISIRTPDSDGGFVEHLFGFPNEIAGGILGILMLAIIFTTVFGAIVPRYDVIKAYLTAGFITAVTAVFLRAMELIGDTVLVAAVLIYLLGLMFIDK